MTRIASLREAQALVPEWAELAETAAPLNPFAHPDWLIPWAERFVRPNEQIWLLTARQRGRLVGVAPFYRRTWRLGIAHSMQLWGTGRHSDLIELPQLLLDQVQPRIVARALATWLCANVRAWDWAQMPLEDSLWFEPDWLPRGGQVTLLTKNVRTSVVLPILDGRRPAMKRNLRESLRRSRNRLNRSHFGQWSVRCVNDGDEMRGALSDLRILHRQRSQLAGKELHPDALADEADWALLSAAVMASARRGAAAIYRLMIRGEAVSALLVLRSRDSTYFLLSGMSQQAWQFSPVTLLQACAINDAVRIGHRSVNLSVGLDTAKLRWSEELAISIEFVLVPNRLFSRFAFAGFWQASAAAELFRESDRHKLLS